MTITAATVAVHASWMVKAIVGAAEMKPRGSGERKLGTTDRASEKIVVLFWVLGFGFWLLVQTAPNDLRRAGEEC